MSTSPLTVINGQTDGESDLVGYGELIEEYFKARPAWKPLTKHTHYYDLKVFLKWLSGRPFTSANVQLFADTFKASRSSAYAEKLCKHACKFGQWMWQTGYLSADPSHGVKKPRIILEQPKPGFTPEEYRRMVEHLRETGKHQLLSMVIMCYHTGFALIDACHLRWDEVDLEKGFIIKKREKMNSRTKSEATIPIFADTDLEADLLRLQAKWAPAKKGFVNPDLAAWYDGVDCESSYAGNRVQTMFVSMVKGLGITNRGTHGFRRRVLTALANNPTMNLMHAAAVSGHRDINSLKRYVVVDPQSVKASVEGTLREMFGQAKPDKLREIHDTVLPKEPNVTKLAEVK